MRTPLIVLVSAYAVSILGFVLIPGVDHSGQPWKMDFFHAFYFVSFMGSTIGFGEIPYPFTGAQRLWTLFTIYATVISWLYAIGTLFALIQTPLFRAAVSRNAFIRRVKRIDQPFYIVCGYGETGRIVVEFFMQQEIDCVVIDKNPDRINELDLEDLPRELPRLNGDCSDTETLARAGVQNDNCKGVVAVTHDDEVNLKVAIASKLLNPAAKVYCWAENADTVANMDSFGTDHIINPYEVFAESMSLALTSPNRLLLHQWLSSAHNAPLYKPVSPPKGRWILCGYGRFGKAVRKKLLAHGLPVTVIELEPLTTNAPKDSIKGRGTEAETLEAAEIHKAVGIIAGTDHDVNNLSILLTAKSLKPDIFTIARQELASNSNMFAAAKLDLVTNNSTLIASSLLSKITTPLTAEFLSLASDKQDDWAKSVVDQLLSCVDSTNPKSWVITLGYHRTKAFVELFNSGENIFLHHIMRQPTNRKLRLPCVALLIKRDDKEILMPDDKTPIYPHDRILFAGNVKAKRTINQIIQSKETLHYTMSGINLPVGTFWKWMTKTRLP